ncbi:MAG: M15 family metallopeptidase [Bacteroidota bacterium]
MRFYFKIKMVLVIVFAGIMSNTEAQKTKENPFHLKIVADINEYHDLVMADSNKRLVDLGEYSPEINLDIRYATTNNFTHRIVYSEPKAFVRLPVGKSLKKAEDELKSKGLGLKIMDTYRPYAATLLFWDIIRDTLFVAAPWKGSRHNRGCAVDVTLIDLKSGKELEMPTKFDDFTIHSAVTDTPKSEKARINRQRLIEVMEKNGFTVFASEWWHFDYNGWEKYELMDISFKELKKIK